MVECPYCGSDNVEENDHDEDFWSKEYYCQECGKGFDDSDL